MKFVISRQTKNYLYCLYCLYPHIRKHKEAQGNGLKVKR